MAVDVDESDYEGDVASRPGSRMSAARSTASGSRSRRVSDPIKGGSVSSGSRLRSFGTESTPAEQYENGDETLKTKRLTATQAESVQNGMMAWTRKVLQIQQKTALASERVQGWKNRSAAAHSSTEDERSNDSDAIPVRARLAKGTKLNFLPTSASSNARMQVAQRRFIIFKLNSQICVLSLRLRRKVLYNWRGGPQVRESTNEWTCSSAVSLSGQRNFGGYTEVLLPVSPHHDYNVQAMQIDPARRREKGDWQESIHPSGAAYYYNDKTRTYTEMNVGTCSEEQLTRLESWIDASRSKIDGKQWLLVVDPMLVRGEEVYPYYYVVPENQIITWVEPIDGYILFQECTAWHWNHKRLELEAQYWKHVEYFPRGVAIPVSEVRNLRAKLNWYQALSMEQSTAATIFWTLDQMKEMGAELAIAETLARPNGMVEEPGVAICMGERRRDLKDSPFMTGLAVAMLCIPMMVLRRLKNIYVDGLVNGVDVRGFMDDFIAQAKSQTTVASVIMAVNASILAIPGLGSQLTTKTLCSISFLLSVYCIIGCTMAQHFAQRLKSLDFAAYYLQEKMLSLVILTSIPSFYI
ncbi:hypothetical protein BD769DRAFT_1671701 [Suillus cothurnatus]|nr:hypothetical protein BD769DRAFT_1671701 [Suillus cothurnatus]